MKGRMDRVDLHLLLGVQVLKEYMVVVAVVVVVVQLHP